MTRHIFLEYYRTMDGGQSSFFARSILLSPAFLDISSYVGQYKIQSSVGVQTFYGIPDRAFDQGLMPSLAPMGVNEISLNGSMLNGS